jgi:hypothetical protein
MVNVNSQKDYLTYNSYYRPSLDDTNFIPSQGVKPLYYYEYGRLRGTVEPQITNANVNLKEIDYNYNDDSNESYSFFYFIIFMTLLYPIITIVKKII